VVLWDMAGRKRLGSGTLAVPEGGVTGVAFSPDGTTLAAGYGISSGAGGVVLWDAAGRKRLGSGPLAVPEGGVTGVAFSPDGKALAAGYGTSSGAGGVVLWDMAGRKRLGPGTLAVPEGGVRGVAFSPDGTTLAAASMGGVVLWDITGRKRLDASPLIFTIGRMEGRAMSLAFNPDGDALAVGYLIADGKTVVLWDTASRKRLDVWSPGEGVYGVFSTAYSSDGKLFAAGHGFGTLGGVVLWDVAGRRRFAECRMGYTEGEVAVVAFSPDGTTLAAGYGPYANMGILPGIPPGILPDGGGVVLWDVVGRKRLGSGPLAVTEGPVMSVAFSPDGNTLAVGSKGRDGGPGEVTLWAVGLQSWKRKAGEIANRNFTDKEWQDYFPSNQPYRKTFDWLPESPDVELQSRTESPPTLGSAGRSEEGSRHWRGRP
jgi:WD40 repeat protein